MVLDDQRGYDAPPYVLKCRTRVDLELRDCNEAGTAVVLSTNNGVPVKNPMVRLAIGATEWLTPQ